MPINLVNKALQCSSRVHTPLLSWIYYCLIGIVNILDILLLGYTIGCMCFCFVLILCIVLILS
ncbi:hypothetical protein HanIR_Chr11g0545601 [Helianthus annuus]|nr:hypothetical protein HanIR_Chr11g0545601 [Helianthus annuus]